MSRFTYRKLRIGIYTEVKRNVRGVVKVTTCCCAKPGFSRKECMATAGNKTPCRCHCHDTKCHCNLVACKCKTPTTPAMPPRPVCR